MSKSKENEDDDKKGDSIVKLFPTEKPNGDLVTRLEELLKDAKSGELRAFAFAGVLRGERSCTGWCSPDEKNEYPRLVTAMVRLMFRLGGE